MFSAFALMVPMIYLSGLIFPIENMPAVFQYVSYIIPVRYYGNVLRGIFLRGSGPQRALAGSPGPARRRRPGPGPSDTTLPERAWIDAPAAGEAGRLSPPFMDDPARKPKRCPCWSRVRYVDWSTVRESRKGGPAPLWLIILEDIRSQNRAILEAVEASRTALEGRLDLAALRADVILFQGRFEQLDQDSRSRDPCLEVAIQDLKVSVQQKGVDIRNLAAGGEALSHLEERVSALERRPEAQAGRISSL